MLYALLATLACTDGPKRSVLWVSIDGARQDALPPRADGFPTIGAWTNEAQVFTSVFAHSDAPVVQAWNAQGSVTPEALGPDPTAWTGTTLAAHLSAEGWATAAFVGRDELAQRSSGPRAGFTYWDDVPPDLARSLPSLVTRANAWAEQQSGPTFVWIVVAEGGAPYTPSSAPAAPAADFDGSAATIAPYRDGERPVDGAALARARALYAAELEEVDAGLEPLVEPWKDAVVVVSSHHGESFHPAWPFRSDRCLSDSVLHVPLVVRVPGLAAATHDRLAGVIDIAPTVASAVGAAPLPGASGVSLLAETPPRDWIAARTAGPDGDAMCGGFTTPALALRDARLRAVWSDDRAEAWNPLTDPEEANPLEVPSSLVDARQAFIGAAIGAPR